MIAVVMWLAVGTCIAFAATILVIDKKLIDARRELVEWRKYAARAAIGDAQDAVAKAEWLR